jgi:hypothetical protein
VSWLSQIRTYLGHDRDPFIVAPDENEVEEVTRIRESAKNALDQAQNRRAEVHEVTTSLASLRARNHFGESIQLAMMPRRTES